MMDFAFRFYWYSIVLRGGVFIYYKEVFEIEICVGEGLFLEIKDWVWVLILLLLK